MGSLDLLNQSNPYIKTQLTNWKIGSLYFLIQANLHTKTQPNPLIYGFLGLTQPIQPKDALHSKIQLFGMDKNILEAKTKRKQGKNNLLIENLILDMYRGFTWAEMASSNTQNMDLYFQPLSIKKKTILQPK